MGSMTGANPAALIAELQNGAELINYYDKAATDGLLGGKSDTTHGHNEIVGLKAGAYTDKTASKTDSVEGRLLKVGDFGIGLNNVPYVSDLDALVISGVYAFNAGATGSPVTYGVCQVLPRAGGEVLQLLIEHSTGRVFTRSRTGAGSWTQWNAVMAPEQTALAGAVDLEIGTVVSVIAQTGIPNLNQDIVVRLRTDLSTGYTDTGTGAVLVGLWRARGIVSATQIYFLAQRVS